MSEVRYLDDKIRYEKEKEREMEIRKYEEEREEIHNWRERERSERMLIKINQLKKFQEMQVKVYSNCIDVISCYKTV